MNAQLRDRLLRLGQEPLLAHFDAQDEDVRARLTRQIESLDLDLVADLQQDKRLAEPLQGEMSAPPYVASDADDAADRERGEEELRAGRVAFALLAGGQASRLQWDGPKGTYPIGPETERSLFQIHVERVMRARDRFGPLPPLAITTSEGTDTAIREFFAANDHFGFDPARADFACQESLPALDDEGRFMLAANDRVFTSPDGHGGAIRALATAGVLARWQDMGITTVCTFQVDNPLLPAADTAFIGRLVGGGAPLATKVVLKTESGEKVGVVALVSGKPAIVEYSEITEEQALRRDPDGQLTFRLGSIAAHAFDLGFLRGELARGLPLHCARKEIPCLEGRKPGRKYERFLFDLFPAAASVSVVEVLREREYAPLKNLEGADSAATVRDALQHEYARWFREAGRDAPDGTLEISPLVAEGPGDLR
jgi:UDP-N-acetylglucosamine/UDP-N-acetylgalactosamine diphosphorylase